MSRLNDIMRKIENQKKQNDPAYQKTSDLTKARLVYSLVDEKEKLYENQINNYISLLIEKGAEYRKREDEEEDVANMADDVVEHTIATYLEDDEESNELYGEEDFNKLLQREETTKAHAIVEKGVQDWKSRKYILKELIAYGRIEALIEDDSYRGNIFFYMELSKKYSYQDIRWALLFLYENNNGGKNQYLASWELVFEEEGVEL